MAYITFPKKDLINLEFALKQEVLRANCAGGYSNTSIVNCNTRKYHGLFVVPQPQIDHENHVLLSCIDETITQQNEEFNLGLHMYPNGYYHPKGHKYLKSFEMDPVPKHVFRVGGVHISREILLLRNDERLLIKYEILDAHSPVLLRIRPFLAFRNVHRLSKANVYVEKKYEEVENGIACRMYAGYSKLFIQCNKKVAYTHVPDWYYNLEYIQERDRGYDFQEDLFVPGFFEVDLKKGESFIVSVGLSERKTSSFQSIFSRELKNRIPRKDFYSCLLNAASQFIVKKNGKTEVIAGYPWFGRWGRDTFISLPGLTLAQGDLKTCKSVLDTMSSELSGALFPNIGHGAETAYNSVDAPLWYFWAVQQYYLSLGDASVIIKDYGKKLKQILTGFKEGSLYGIRMNEDHLIEAGVPGKALTWMDAMVEGEAVTPRRGCPVEINALWYNAVCFMLDLAKRQGDDSFLKEWNNYPRLIAKSICDKFWDKDLNYVADVVQEDKQDMRVRPNMIFLVSLPYSPITDEMKKGILDKVEQELLTTRGLRTLSPQHSDYKGIYKGGQEERDCAYHQGTVWPWLLGHFCEAYLKLHGKSGKSKVEKLYLGFEDVMKEAGIGTVSEIYDGDPPHNAKGAISQAWSVAELLRIKSLLDQY
ncbi:MAG: amylo-alpha-1,6-glucosidase [Bacteroidales bacterium]